MEQKCANCGNGKWRDGVTAITDICIECKCVEKDGKPQPSNWKPKVSSNADRIRAMSDEELAEFLESTHSQMAIKLGGEYIVRGKEWDMAQTACERRMIMENKKLGKGVKFERIRRITGYLVGTLDKWNDAKKAEEKDRVKHSVGGKKDGK